jgi:hypothetical protein
MDKWPKVVIGEFIPPLITALSSVVMLYTGVSLLQIGIVNIVGLLFMLILMGYRIISGIILILQTFSDAADALPKLNALLQGILQPGQPKR